MKKILFLLIIGIRILHAQNFIVSEQFQNCNLPAHWSLQTDQGTFGFSILKSSLMPSYDASCTIVYSQTDQNDQSDKKFTIRTTPFQLYAYEEYTFNYGLKFTKTNASAVLKVYAIVDNLTKLIQTYNSDVFQNGLVLVNQSLVIPTNSHSKLLQIAFEYEVTGNDYNSIVLIDNLSLYGPDNDDCSRAVLIKPDTLCYSGNNNGAFMTGPAILCPGTFYSGLWYKFNADYSGYLKINTHAGFNDALSVFEGSCPTLNNIACFNTDEYGFEGEQQFIQVIKDKTYFFRVAKQYGYYGREDATDLCVSIQKMDPLPPTHDHCDNSIQIQLNASCLSEINIQADFNNPLPSLNNKSKADVWYHFKSNSTQPLEIITHADFAEVITVYKGNCNQLTEVKCEDLGGKLILDNPTASTDYYIQVSAYFSTLEGHLCLEVKTKSPDKPANEDCINAKAILLNQACLLQTNINSTKSNVKPSCVVYSAPDVWYSFIAPVEKNVAIQINAGFLFHWAIYSGSCNNLQEVNCGKAPDPCKGPLEINGLIPGKTYFLQIITAINPLKASEGNICVRIDELSKVTPYKPLSLELSLECIHGILGKVNYIGSGGTGQYHYEGPGSNNIFYPGTEVEGFLEDEVGCRDFDKIIIDCQPPAKCTNSNLDLKVTTECLTDSIGRQTGEVILHVKGTGGSGAYYLYGTQDSSLLKHGDTYQIIIIDSDSCYVVEEGKINCPPFDCSQSKLSVSANYECIDTLFKARYQINVTGQLGKYSVVGNKSDELLDQGEHYETEVIDEAGCSNSISGEIICSFDSCAYARPELNVSYDCIKDSLGNPSGKAILNIIASSYAGSLIISGGKNGDTLNNLETYLIEISDAFGCKLSKTGDINCITVGTYKSAGNGSTMFFPNPANNKLNVFIPNNKDHFIRCELYNSDAKLFKQFFVNALESANKFTIDIEKYPSGMMYLKLEGNQFYDIIRFVKI